MSEVEERLADVPLFSRCSKRDVAAISRHLQIIKVAEDQCLVTQHEPGDAFFVVLAGKVAIETDGQLVATLHAGQHFGELALLEPGPRTATVRTCEPTEVGVLSIRMFRVLIREMPEMTERLLASLAAQLRIERDR